MSKTITIHCAGCSNTKQVVTQNDDHPDVIPGRVSQWYCPTCEKKKAELEARKKLDQEKKAREAAKKAQEYEQKKPQWLQTPEGQAWQKEQTRLEQEAISQLQKNIKESEEIRRQARELLKEENDQARIKQIEANLKSSEAETERLKNLIVENERKKAEKLAQLERDLIQTESQVNSNPTYQPPPPEKKNKSSSTSLICDGCEAEIEGEYIFLQNPLDGKNINVCKSCQPDFKLGSEATQKIFAGQITTEAEINQLNFADSDVKIVLKIYLRLKKGEKVDNAYIDQTSLKPKDKQKLKSQLPQARAILEKSGVIPKQPQFSSLVCSLCSRAILVGSTYFKDHSNGSIACRDCYIKEIQQDLKKAQEANEKLISEFKELKEKLNSCSKCKNKILSGEAYYEDEKSPNKKTCNSCHKIEVQQRLNKPIWKEPVFIGIVGGTVFLVLIGLIYDYYKKKKQEDKES